jgi:hypothetical protein
MNLTAWRGVARTSYRAAVAIVVDHSCGRVYDSSYPVTAHAPRGRAPHLRSPASIPTRANLAAAFEPRPNAVLDHVSIQEQWRPRLDQALFGRARSALRSTCRSAQDQRSRPVERVYVRLREAAPSHRRIADGAGPAVRPERGQPGVRAAAAACGSAHRTRFDTRPLTRRYARRLAQSNRPRSFAKVVGHIGHRLGARFYPAPQRVSRCLRPDRKARDGWLANAR